MWQSLKIGFDRVRKWVQVSFLGIVIGVFLQDGVLEDWRVLGVLKVMISSVSGVFVVVGVLVVIVVGFDDVLLFVFEWKFFQVFGECVIGEEV